MKFASSSPFPTTPPPASEKTLKDQKFIAAMSVYAVLGLLAGLTLDGRIRLAVWVFLGGIAIKTILVILKREQD